MDDYEQETYEEPDYETFERNCLDRDRDAGEYDPEPEDEPVEAVYLTQDQRGILADVLQAYIDKRFLDAQDYYTVARRSEIDDLDAILRIIEPTADPVMEPGGTSTWSGGAPL